MNRLLVALLAALDAVIAAAVGVAAALAPLTLLWVFGLTGAADWSALWPASVRVWQLGHLVPVHVDLPLEYLTATGIASDAATFVVSLAPLAFAGFTAIFAARSGARAGRAGEWAVGAAAGTVATALLATGLALTSPLPVAGVVLWQAIVLPAAVFAVPAFAGGIVTAWRDDDALRPHGIRARLAGRWSRVPEAVARGGAVVVVGLVGLGALTLAAALVARGGEVVALYEAAHVDLMGAVVLTIGQLAYLPTLIVWAAAFVAGPGFALGAGTAVSPSGTSLGVVPGVPVLGVIPPSISPWLLLLALLVIGVGALAGRAARRALQTSAAVDPAAPRVIALCGVVLLSGVAAAVLAVVASGSAGPGRLHAVGPEPGPFALAVGVEVAIGAAIALLSPHRAEPVASAVHSADVRPAAELVADGQNATEPIDLTDDRAWTLYELGLGEADDEADGGPGGGSDRR